MTEVGYLSSHASTTLCCFLSNSRVALSLKAQLSLSEMYPSLSLLVFSMSWLLHLIS